MLGGGHAGADWHLGCCAGRVGLFGAGRPGGEAPGCPQAHSVAGAAGRPARTAPAPAAGWSPRPAPPDARRPAHPESSSRTPGPADRACGWHLARPPAQATAQRRRREDHARRAATRGQSAVVPTTRNPARRAPDSQLLTAGRLPPAGPAGHRDLRRPVRGKPSGGTGHAIRRRLPARSARSEKAYAASTTPEIPITPALPPQSIPEGPSRAAHISS